MPSADVAAEAKVGTVPSTIELLVTVVVLRDAASLPAESCIAFVSSVVLGSV